MPRFVPGLKLSRLFYEEEVEPILRKEFPELVYSAAVIGWGSEVLGFDTSISRDHHWGPRVLLFLSEKDSPQLSKKIRSTLSQQLPYEFMGYSTNFSNPEQNGVRHPVKISSGPVDHMVNIYTIRSLFKFRIGHDPFRKISVKDWLSFPQQRLLELTTGEVYHDGLGQLEKIRSKFKYYPRDIWLYLLAAQWIRIAHEEAFVGRTGHVGDELGSSLLAARLIRELMKLSFLMEQQYAPYSKWLGSAFQNLKIAKELTPVFRRVLAAEKWQTRQRWLSAAYVIVVKHHNALGITEPLPEEVSNYYGRPYLVIHAERFPQPIMAAIKDPNVRKIRTPIGSVDQYTDSTGVIEDLGLLKKLKGVY